MNGFAAPFVFTSAVDGSKISGQVYALKRLLYGKDTPALTEWSNRPVSTVRSRGGTVNSIVSS